MRPISKFAIYFALAGALALLFAYSPKTRLKTNGLNPQENPAQPAQVIEKQKVQKSGPGGASQNGEATLPKTSRESPSLATIPAIRGSNNYGWVQLPLGTRVDLVRKNGRELWVRWDGTLVKIDSSLVTRGAVVLKSAETRFTRS